MRQAQGIGFKQRRLPRFISFHHAVPAARITADAGQTQGEIGGNQACIHKWANQRNRACGVTAWVGHAGGRTDAIGLAGAQLGKAIDPIRMGAVCGRSIDDARLMTAHGVNHGHRFTRRVVVQTQDDHIGLRHQSTLGLGIFALGRVYADQIDLWQQSQTFAYL